MLICFEQAQTLSTTFCHETQFLTTFSYITKSDIHPSLVYTLIRINRKL